MKLQIALLMIAAVAWTALVTAQVAPTAAPGGEVKPAAAPARHVLPVSEVVVYEDRALVTREGEVPLQGGGMETVLVGGLPPALSETSLRAGLADPAKGRVISVASEVERRREIQDTVLRAVEEERRAAARKIAEVDDDLARLAARETYIGSYEKLIHKAISERTGGGADPETAKWGDALKFVRDGRSAVLAARREAERKKEDLSRTHADLDAEANRLRRPEERSVRTAEVALETRAAAAAAGGRVRLRVSYVIEGAGWVPRYDARFDAEKGDLAVTYFGEVRQRTGEDWKDAKLILSTARPSVGAARPDLLPLRLAAADAGPKGKGIAHREVAGARPLAGLEDAEVAERAAAAPEAAAGALVISETRENATSAVFTVPGLAAIPADGRPHKVPITTFRERAEASFETVPRLERFVYLKCAAKNGSPYPMLAGPIDIFRGSGFIGTSRLKFTAPGRPFEISAGIEESLKVRRAVTAYAWTGRGKEKRHGFDIEVANFGEKPQRVTVIEGYPVSDIEEVRVTLDDSTTPASEHALKDGTLKWRLEVSAGEARKVHVEYTVRYPDDYAGEG